MGILLQRGNAAILGNRIPTQPGAYRAPVVPQKQGLITVVIVGKQFLTTRPNAAREG